MEHLQKKFTAGKVTIDILFHLNGCEMEQDQMGSIHIYLKRMQNIHISQLRNKQGDTLATNEEIRQYRCFGRNADVSG